MLENVIWFDAPVEGGGGNPNGGGGKPEEKPADKTFTQADVDRIVGERAKRAEESAIGSLLKDLGFEKTDDLKTLIGDVRKKQDAEKSELQKAQESLAALTKAKEAADIERAAAIERANVTLMRAAVMAEAAKADYRIKPEALADVWSFIDKASIKPKDGADGEYTGIGDALKTLAKAKPYLVQDGNGHGTPRPGAKKPADQRKPEPRPGFTL